MNLNKLLGTVALTVFFGTIGCTVSRDAGKPDVKYYFNGKIGEDHVRFYEPKVPHHDEGCPHFWANVLEVTRSDGVKIIYTDWTPNVESDDFRLEEVKIIKNGVELVYTSKDAVWQEVVAEAQKQFDSYLQKILDTKESINSQGLELLKTKDIFRAGD